MSRHRTFVEIDCGRCDLTGSGAGLLSELLHRMIGSDWTLIHVNLEHNAIVDTPLLAVLIDARRRALLKRTQLVVRASPALRQLAEICRVEEVLVLRGGTAPRPRDRTGRVPRPRGSARERKNGRVRGYEAS